MIRTIVYYFAIVLLISSCTSGKKALRQGNYDEAVYKAVKRLRTNGNHGKSLQILAQTYPLAQQWHLNRVKTLETSYDAFKWEPIAREYAQLNSFYQEILRCPGCLSAIPSPVNYATEYESAKLKSASERYNAGLEALDKGKLGDRNEAKTAYRHFETADSWIKGYKDVADKMKVAEQYAMVTVVVEPIPMHSQTLKLSSEFFDNKINEFLLQAPLNRFVKFYTLKEAKRLGINRPHQVIQMVFDDFVVGQTYMHEKETELVKDSILLATYEVAIPSEGSSNKPTENKISICHTEPGSKRSQTIQVTESALKAHLEHGDEVGTCDKSPSSTNASKKEIRKVYGQVKARLHVYTKTVESKGLLDLKIIDGATRRVVSQEKLPGVFVWQSQWGHFNGDERALEKQHLQLTKNKEVPPPAPQDLFMQFTQPIYQQLTAKITHFYTNY